MQIRIKDYKKFDQEWKDKIWRSVKDLRETKDDLETIEDKVEEHKEETGYVKKVVDWLGEKYSKFKKWLGDLR